ncbi:MAG TPA: ABC transporter permease [Terracidiphilus sp.]|nr:ABC transporter permease [Terracidiphilus sp.]
MQSIRVLIVRFASLFRKQRLDQDLEDELQAHIELAVEEHQRRGLPAEQARALAVREFGGVTQTRENYRVQRGLPFLESIWHDIAFGLRQLRKNLGFTAIAALSLALAIGANTTIFSIARQLLYERLSVPHPDQLRMLRWNGDSSVVIHGMWGDFDSRPQGGMTGSIFSYPVYQQLRAHNNAMRDLFAFKEDGVNATVRGTAQRMAVAMISGNYFAGLEVRPQIGRTIQPSDESVPGAGTVAVISDGLWDRAYDRSPSALGQTIKVNGTQLTIIGVNPKGFTGAKDVQTSPDLFVPLTMQPLIDPKGRNGTLLQANDLWWLNVMGRLRPGVSEAQAQTALGVQLQADIRATMTMHAGDTMPKLVLAPGNRGLHFADGTFKKPVNVLLALTGFVLLLACANIANLLLARGAERQREMSVRLALGATRKRLLRQLLTESLMLAAGGGAGGLVLGYFVRNAIPGLMTNAWERTRLNIPFDWSVFAFCSAVTLLTGILFGFAPAWFAARAEVSSSLKGSAQSTTRRRKGASGKSTVAFQIALSMLLVVGAGLFVRTMWALSAVNIGFNPDHLILFEIQPPAARYPPGKDVQLHERLEERIAALPGVESVSLGSEPYIANNYENSDFLPEGESFAQDRQQGRGEAEFNNLVGANFFHTMQIPILAGRSFGAQDTATSAKVAIINQALALKRFPGVYAIGKRFRADRDPRSPWITIVGICANTHYASLRKEPPAQFFLPYVQQRDVGGMVYQVRTPMAPAAFAPELRQVVASIDRDLPVIDLRTQREQMDATEQVQRALAALTAGFGLLALALACVGIYGVMAYSVAQRTNEIGIRLALGAHPAHVRAMVLRESLWIACVGIAAGLLAATGLTRLVRSMLFGVGPYDPATMAIAALLLLVVGLAASWVPARRAAGIQPMEAIRHE